MLHRDRHQGADAGRLAVAETTVTRAVLEAARETAVRAGERAALKDPQQSLSHSRFAAVVPAAAAGLRRQGVLPGDVGAVHLADACDLALALHAVVAAGAVPVVLPRGGSVGELAAIMSECGARFLLTGGEPASAALAATERSYVRQVFAFGDVPGATAFGRLVLSEEDADGTAYGLTDGMVDPLRDRALVLGDPFEELTHADRLADLYRLAAAVGPSEADVLVCSAGDVPMPTWIGLIDLCLMHGATFAAVPEPGPAALLAAVEREAATVVVVSPAGLRALTYDHVAAPRTGLRLLVSGATDPEVVQACRNRHGWTVAPLS
ncbi:AMP-binding protein [Spirillospora sp. NPDC047279]|uniref:AMP-binding protein n=1 Tax=Spirillospora sp. NPDC047279 TaxID=3155478 RepID=UPI0033CCDB62